MTDIPVVASTSLQAGPDVPSDPTVVGLPSNGCQLGTMEIALSSDPPLELGTFFTAEACSDELRPTDEEITALVNVVIAPNDDSSTADCQHVAADVNHLDTHTADAASFDELIPLPKANVIVRRKRKVQHAAVITSSPFKNELIEKTNKKQRKGGLSKSQKTGKTAHTDSDDEPLSRKVLQLARLTKSSKKKNMDKTSSSTDADTDTTPCGTCGVTFNTDEKANNGRNWVQCQSCSTWHHNECQGIANNARPKQFVCISCQ